MCDCEYRSSSESNRSCDESNDSSCTGSDDADEHVVVSEFLPYQNEPLADSSSESDDDGERDEDGLSANVLRQRYENEIPLDAW